MTSKDEMLNALGLQTKPTTISNVASSAGLIAIGAAIGAVAGVTFAPKAGREMREDMREAMPDGIKGHP